MPAQGSSHRWSHTLRLLQEQGHVSVSELSETLDVSAVTIRKDLRRLEQRSLLIRTHGGAMAPVTPVGDVPIDEKAKLNAEEKRRIGAAAAALVEDGDRIILDSGSTTTHIVSHLAGRSRVTVATGSIQIGLEVLKFPDHELIMLGGPVRPSSASVVGEYAQRMLAETSFSRLFLAGDGLDVAYGLTTTSVPEAHLNQAMIEAADQVVVVLDSSKFRRRGLSRICEVGAIDLLVTDTGAPPDVLTALRSAGVRVQTV